LCYGKPTLFTIMCHASLKRHVCQCSMSYDYISD
jgi:hypothetical protein